MPTDLRLVTLRESVATYEGQILRCKERILACEASGRVASAATKHLWEERLACYMRTLDSTLAGRSFALRQLARASEFRSHSGGGAAI